MSAAGPKSGRVEASRAGGSKSGRAEARGAAAESDRADDPPAGGRDDSPDAVVERFAIAWSAPSPERLNALLHPQVRLRQPVVPELVGHAAASGFWQRLFALVPDLHAEVLDWAAGADGIFIEARMQGTLAGRPLGWGFVDRLRLDEGLIAERDSYFDPAPLAFAILARPSAWPLVARTAVGLVRDAARR